MDGTRLRAEGRYHGPFHPLRDDFLQMVDAGVDVRKYRAANPFLVNFEQAASKVMQYWAINVHSLANAGVKKQIPNASSGGAEHLEAYPRRNAPEDGRLRRRKHFRAYASGIDFVDNETRRRSTEVQGTSGDVTIRVEGCSEQALHLLRAALEQNRFCARQRSSRPSATRSSRRWTYPLLDLREMDPVPGGQQHTHHRTAPTMNFASLAADLCAPVNCIVRLIAGFKQNKLSFASDITEFRAAQRKAITAAEQ